MKTNPFPGIGLISLLVAFIFQGGGQVAAIDFHDHTVMEARTVPNREQGIPEGYKTWSLFLVSNPEWLLHQNKERLNELYERFRVFGDAIGSENEAVWLCS